MMNQQRANLVNSNNFRNTASIHTSSSPQIGAGYQTMGPPPIPPRQPISNYQHYNGLQMYPSYTNSYGFGNSGLYNRGYNSYGYGSYPNISGYNQFGGPSGDVENRFVQYAEESTRPAFQSIEAMVHTFSSVTMMLESTFFAMTSSFRAILEVADNMGKLREMFGKFLSSFVVFRFIRWLYWKAKCIMGLRGQDSSSESLWRHTIAEVMQDEAEQRGPSTWPIFVFLAMIFAAPYLIHKMMNKAKSNTINVNNPKEWMQCKEPVFTATVLYDFVAATPQELNLKCGQKLWLAPQSLQPKNMPGWWRATDSINVGLIPSAYVTVVGQLKKKSESNDLSNPNVPNQATVIKEDSGKTNSEPENLSNEAWQNECFDESHNVQTCSN